MPTQTYITRNDIQVLGEYDIYVYANGATRELYTDAAGQNPYGSDPNFMVPKNEIWAFYFRFTENSETGSTFPDQPLDWSSNTPAGLHYRYMNEAKTEFSIVVVNIPCPSVLEYPCSFTLESTTPSGGPVVISPELLVPDILVSGVGGNASQTRGIDPTIVEKGEIGGGSGHTR